MPANCLKITSDTFLDKSVITNVHYREYLHYLRVVSKNKLLYDTALPDTTIWLALDTCFHVYKETYFRNPEFDDFPALGLNYSQAKDYSKWRTHVVMKRILYQGGFIDQKTHKSMDTYIFPYDELFTPSDTIKLKKEIKYKLHFDIPSTQDFTHIFGYPKIKKSVLINNIPEHNKKSPCHISSILPTYSFDSFKRNTIYIFENHIKEGVKEGELISFEATGLPPKTDSEQLNGIRKAKFVVFRNICLITKRTQ
jgi:hypothetical protein